MQLFKHRQIRFDSTNPAPDNTSPTRKRVYLYALPNTLACASGLYLLAILLTGLALAQDAAPLFPKQDMTDRVKLADGFRLLKLAGNSQIPNAYCMAVHASGDLIVSGPGYLRRLNISDKGLEKVTDLPHPPAGGAQGLWCEGDDLFFVGGEGLCRIKGALGDLPAEELAKLPNPEVLLKICLLYTSPSPRDKRQSRMPSSA